MLGPAARPARALSPGGVPVDGCEVPTDVVMPPMPEMVSLFTAPGAEILGPPPSLSDVS
jgi:hypothetical protein